MRRDADEDAVAVAALRDATVARFVEGKAVRKVQDRNRRYSSRITRRTPSGDTRLCEGTRRGWTRRVE
jgi:hypothetical protein